MRNLSLLEMSNLNGTGFFHTVRVGADLACGMWVANCLLSRVAYTNPVTGTAASIMDIGCSVVGLAELGSAIWDGEF